MASRSHKYIIPVTVDDGNMKSSSNKETALKHSMKINLDPLLVLDKSLIEQIPILYLKEGKA